MKVSLEPGLTGHVSASTELRTQPTEAGRVGEPRVKVNKGDYLVQETNDPGWSFVKPPGNKGFLPAGLVRCHVGAHIRVTHQPTTQPLFAPGGPRFADVAGYPGLADDRFLVAAQAVAAAAPGRLRLGILDWTGGGVRVRCFDADGSPNVCMLSRRVLHDAHGKPVGSGRGAAWPLFLEKAFAASHASYDDLCSIPSVNAALQWMVGGQVRTVAPILPGWVEDIAELFEAGECVVLHKSDADYAVVGVTRAAGACALTLANPRGGSGWLQPPATFQVTTHKPAGKWRSYTRSHIAT